LWHEDWLVTDPPWWKRPQLPERYQHLSFEEVEGAEEAAEKLAERATLMSGPVSVLQEVGRLMPPSANQALLALSALQSGELVALWCDAADAPAFIRTEDGSGVSWPGSRASRAVTMTITLDATDGTRAAQVRVAGIDLTYPIVDARTDGCFSIISGICELREDGPDANGIVCNAQGDVLRRITLGDGILFTQTTPTGKTWAGYSDTGIIGNHGWNFVGHGSQKVRTRTPIGVFGLVRFDATDTVEWEFGRAQYEARTSEREVITHVYALNIIDETAWTYYYERFAIARVEADDIQIWDTDVEAAEQLLVAHDRIALIGGYGPAYDRIVVGHVSDTGFSRDSTGRLVLPDGSDLPLTTHNTARGSTLHVIADNRWYRLRL
jgi:hypothetical protein